MRFRYALAVFAVCVSVTACAPDRVSLPAGPCVEGAECLTLERHGDGGVTTCMRDDAGVTRRVCVLQ